MPSITNDLLNAGEDLTPLVQPDNKTSFLLTEDECAFVNIINMQTAMLKTLLFTVVSQVEAQMDQQMSVLKSLRDQFITAVATKHGIVPQADHEGSLEIDLSNKLILMTTTPKEP
jgi:hypothetical protein